MTNATVTQQSRLGQQLFLHPFIAAPTQVRVAGTPSAFSSVVGTDNQRYINLSAPLAADTRVEMDGVLPDSPSGTGGGTGAEGPPGQPGTNGTNGTDGREVQLQASATHIQWRYVGTVPWTDVVPLASISGTNGTNGTNGIDGRTISNGSGAPSGGAGQSGDFYLDTAAMQLYGPKTGSAWGSGVSLIGPQGLQGNPGSPGTPGTNGTNGLNAQMFSAVANLGTKQTLSHRQVIAQVGITPASHIMVGLGSMPDDQENNAEFLEMGAMAAVPGTDNFELVMRFKEPTSGPIPIIYTIG